MRPNLSIVALGWVIAGSVPALAIDPEYKVCIDATGTNTGWGICGAALIDRNEARMNGYLKRIREVTDGDTLKAIETEQEAWIKFREVACEFYNDQYAFGREGQVLSYPVCKADMIEARGEQLRDYIRQIDP